MSEVETLAKPVLPPLLKGQRLSLTMDDQVTLVAWITLRVMVLERGGGAAPKAVPFSTDQERRRFLDFDSEGSAEPIDGTYIWAFQYRSPRWAARSNVVNFGLNIGPGGSKAYPLQLTTACVGRLGFQVLTGRWAHGRRLEGNSRDVIDWAPAMAQIWPNPSEPLQWPPNEFYLGDEHYDALLDRFVKRGFPLQS